jgi:hypothetical protein
MTKILAALGLGVTLLLPAGALAKPDQSEKRAAKHQCKAERGTSKATRKAFRLKYRSFSRCVRSNAAEEEAENKAAHKNAAKECKVEREGYTDPFARKYGTNKNGKNAYGKCVSSKAKAKKARMDAEDEEEVAEFKNAAKRCAAELEDLGAEEFRKEYGSNENGRNAFGKCVSKKTRESDS